MQYTWKTLTPFYCGDADARTTHAKTTALLGSLRWWYEALVRALDVYACDPTKHRDQSCEGPSRSHKDGRYCAACAVFGCTGWGKRVGVRLEKGIRLVLPGDANERGLSIKPKNPKRDRGWYLRPGLQGELQLTLVDPDPLCPRTRLLSPLLALVSRWGGLGSRVQHGYGVGELLQDGTRLECNDENVTALLQAISQPFSGQRTSCNEGAWPNLCGFFFAKFPVEAPDEEWVETFRQSLSPGADEKTFSAWVRQSGSVPVSPAVRNVLRFDSSWRPTCLSSQTAQRWFFGTLDPGRRATRIAISHACRLNDPQAKEWQGEIRVFGWIPTADNALPGGVNRATLMCKLHGTLTNPDFWSAALGNSVVPARSDGKCQHQWREFNSCRDTVCRYTDPGRFIASLVC